jgi:hypothetical protein
MIKYRYLDVKLNYPKNQEFYLAEHTLNEHYAYGNIIGNHDPLFGD